MAATRDWLEQALDIVREAEDKMRGLLLKIVEDRDDESLPMVFECARRLKEILESSSEVRSSTDESVDVAATHSEYPKFFRRGDKLVMIGWSKKGRTEYKHEAPRTALYALLSALTNARSNHENVPFKELPPLEDPETGKVYPEYCVRTLLRWLRNIGVVKKNGHQGYSLSESPDPETTINAQWKRLARLNS